MVTLHAFLALLAGFAIMTLIIIAVTAALTKLAPAWARSEGRPAPSYALVSLTYTFAAAAAGGYITAWAARENFLADVLALAVVVLILGALSALQMRGRQPVWFQIAQVTISPLGVMAGGLLRLRITGLL
jgi:hypothetical protein